MEQLRALRRVLSNRRLLAAQIGFSSYTIVMHGAWVALMLYSFDQGGVGQAGLVSFAVLVPAAVVGPFAAIWVNPWAPNRSLSGGLGLQAILIGVVTVSVSTAAPPWLVYLLYMLFSVAQMTTRPTIATVLPKIVDGPEELAAANSATELIETIGLIVEPALAGLVLLSTDGLVMPFLAATVALTAGTLAALSIGGNTHDEFADDASEMPSFASNVGGGLALLGQEKSVLRLVLLLSSVKLVVGTFEVAVVPLTLDQLNSGEATAGFLTSALGVGGMAGAMLSIFLIGRRRLTGPIVAALLIASAPLIAAPLVGSVGPMLVLFTLAGIGRPILAVGGRTLLQGLSADDTLAQLFGFLEGLSMLAVAVGSMGFSLLVVTVGLSPALVIAGLTPILVLVVLYRPIVAIDRDRPEVDAELLSCLRSIPIFSTLPAFRLEQVMSNMSPMTFAPNTVVLDEGDPGDRFHVITDGEAIVDLATDTRTLGPGGFFGEIALLRNQPRMATVRADTTALHVQTLGTEAFLSAVSSVPSSVRRANRVVQQRLDDGDQGLGE